MKMLESEQTGAELMEYSDYPELSPQPSFATPLQLFAVIVYILSQGFTIPILPIGPSWAVWPRLDDFSTLFLFLVYLGTRRNTCPMNRLEHTIFALIIVGAILSLPSTAIGALRYPEIIKGPSFGVFQTYRIIEYTMVWFCIRGMTFSSKQFDKISYTVFFVVVFVVIIGIGNATGAIPSARLLRHLPYDGPWGVLKQAATGAHKPRGPYGWNSGYMVDMLVLFTALLFVSRKPSAMFRIPLVVAVAVVVFLTGSRAATVAWCVCLAILSTKSAKQLIMMLVVISLFFICFYMVVDFFEYEIVERATQRAGTLIHREAFEDKTLAGRTLQWVALLRYMVSDPSVPVLGVGWGFGQIVLEPETGISGAHSMYLSPLLEVGVFGAIMFYILLFQMYRLVRGKDPLLAAIRAAYLAFLVAGITGSIFFPAVSAGSFLGFVGAVFGIGAATHRGRLLEEQLYSEYDPSAEEDSGCEYSA